MADRTRIPTPDHLWNRSAVAGPASGVGEAGTTTYPPRDIVSELAQAKLDRDELAAALDEEHKAILMEYGRGPCAPGTCDVCALLARVRGEAKK